MEAKELIFEEEARKKLLSGIVQITDAIACTLGPQGRNVGIEKSWGSPTIINDGHTIVKEMELPDQFENMGAQLVREAASKLKEKCGDGTTTTSLLLRAMAEEGIKYVSSGASPISLKRGMDKALEAIVKNLEAIKIHSEKEIVSVATVSASGNREIGQLIADAIAKVGKDGVVTIEEGKTTETTIDVVKGMQFDRGYMSPYFCTNAENMTAELVEPAILTVDKKISSIQELLPLLQAVAATGKTLLIIADDIEGDALSTLVINRLKGILKVAAVKAPGFGDRKKAMLEDIAILTGATVIAEETGITLKDTGLAQLGSAERVTITKDHTTIVSGHGQKELIAARIKQLEAEAEKTTSTYDKEKLIERKAKLSGGVAVLKVGGATESEMKRDKQVFQDSLSSTLSALEAGVVAGGGVGLLRAAQKAAQELKLEGDELLGMRIVLKATEAPIRQIAANAGLEAAMIIDQVRNAKGAVGFNAMNEKIEDLIKADVIDAAKTVRSCIVNAVSLAGIVLSSEVLIGDAPELKTSV